MDDDKATKRTPEGLDDDDDDDDIFDGYEGNATRGAAAVMAPLSLDHIDVSALSPSSFDEGAFRSTDIEFDGSALPLDRSLLAMPAPLGALHEFEPRGEVAPPPSLAHTSARSEHSLVGVAVLDLPFYLRLATGTSAVLGPSSAPTDGAAAAAISEGLTAQGVDYEVAAAMAEWRCQGQCRRS